MNAQTLQKWYTRVIGLFFLFVAAFGWAHPNFGGMGAFNRVDTILHNIVGASGFLIGLPGRSDEPQAEGETDA